MTTSPRLEFTYLESGETVPSDVLNETDTWLDAFANNPHFKSRATTAQPGSPVNGDIYLLPGSPTGAAWSGNGNKIALFVNTTWRFITAKEGFFGWVDDENALIGYDGAAWNVLASPSGTYIPTTYLDTDGTLAANSDAKIASQKATKTYVDAKVAGLSWKQAVRVATTANGTLATAFENGDTVDGVTLATGDRILIKNQSSGAENGIYTVNASGAPTRATDADAGSELINATVYVSEGTTNADTQWTCTNNATITLGSTSISFTQINTGSTPLAVASDYRTGTDASKALTADAVWDAADYVALTDAATVAVDMATGINFSLTIGGNRTLGAPTNMKAGQTGAIVITQDGTGSRTLAYNAAWLFAGGTDPTLSTAAGTKDVLFYQVLPGATTVYANLVKAIA